MKKPINTRLHGIFDYLIGFILMVPWFILYHKTANDTLILALIGGTGVLVSLFTNYEMGLVRLIPMGLHLFIDVLAALFLIALPFLFPMNQYSFYWPVFLGIGELIVVFLSSPRPFVVTKRDMNITLP